MDSFLLFPYLFMCLFACCNSENTVKNRNSTVRYCQEIDGHVSGQFIVFTGLGLRFTMK